METPKLETQKLLKAPFGWPAGRGCRFYATGDVETPSTMALLQSFGCPPPVAAKAASCLTHSGVYECRLQLGAAQEVAKCRGLFQMSNLDFELQDEQEARAIHARVLTDR